LDCPQAFSECDNICRHHSETHCRFFDPPRPLSEILTLSERLDRLEKNQTPTPEAKWSRKQWDYVTQLAGRTIHIENKLKEIQKLILKRRSPKY